MPTAKQVLDVYENIPQIRLAINNALSENYIQYSKVGFLVGGKLMVFRRVSRLKQAGCSFEGSAQTYSFYHMIKTKKEWRNVPVTIRGERVFDQGI